MDFISIDGKAITKSTPKKRLGPQLALCESCLVRLECLDKALEIGEENGVWGGMMPAERKQLRR